MSHLLYKAQTVPINFVGIVPAIDLVTYFKQCFSCRHVARANIVALYSIFTPVYVFVTCTLSNQTATNYLKPIWNFQERTPVVRVDCFLVGWVGYTVCPTRYRTRHFFYNSNTNEDIAKKFEQEYVRCVRNEKECVCSAPNCCDTEQRSASQTGSVASGTHCILHVTQERS